MTIDWKVTGIPLLLNRSGYLLINKALLVTMKETML